MPPLVSVVVPVYNAEKFIEASLGAVLSQPFGDIEVVVADNASTDSTPQILKGIGANDKRVRLVRNPRNLGPMRNFWVGMSMSSGTYVKWQAADDRMAPGFLSESVEILEERSDVALVVGAMPPVSEDGTPLEFDEKLGGYVTDYGEFFPRNAIPEDSSSDQPSKRFRAVVEAVTGNLNGEFLYGLQRGDVVRNANPLDVYLGAEKVFIAEVLFRGKAVAARASSSQRVLHPGHFGAGGFKDTVSALDPEFQGRFAMPAARQAWGYARAIRAAHLSSSERWRCYGVLLKKIGRPQTLSRVLRRGPENYLGWGR